jgi:hypothetical protein
MNLIREEMKEEVMRELEEMCLHHHLRENLRSRTCSGDDMLLLLQECQMSAMRSR